MKTLMTILIVVLLGYGMMVPTVNADPKKPLGWLGDKDCPLNRPFC